MLTYTAAKAAARELGFTLRKETPGSSDLVLYRVGAGADSPAAYFTNCPEDALLTARAMAADTEAGRVTLSNRPATRAAMAEIEAADRAAELAPAMIREEAAAVMAAAMRASVPALQAAAATLSRRTGKVAPGMAAILAARAAILRHVAQLKAGAICPELAAAFALPAPRPATLAAATLAALVIAGPAAAEIGPGHWQAAPDSVAGQVAAARAFLSAYPVAAFALCVAGAAAFATWFNL